MAWPYREIASLDAKWGKSPRCEHRRELRHRGGRWKPGESGMSCPWGSVTCHTRKLTVSSTSAEKYHSFCPSCVTQRSCTFSRGLPAHFAERTVCLRPPAPPHPLWDQKVPCTAAVKLANCCWCEWDAARLPPLPAPQLVLPVLWWVCSRHEQKSTSAMSLLSVTVSSGAKMLAPALQGEVLFQCKSWPDKNSDATSQPSCIGIDQLMTWPHAFPRRWGASLPLAAALSPAAPQCTAFTLN